MPMEQQTATMAVWPVGSPSVRGVEMKPTASLWTYTALAAVVVLLLGACASVAGNPDPAAVQERSAAVIKVRPDGQRDWRPDRPVRVRVQAGTLTEVAVVSATGRPVKGRLDRSGTIWTSKRPVLAFGTDYTVRAKAVDAAGLAARTTARFRTEKPSTLVSTSFVPGTGDVVGVGMPVIVTFDAPVQDRAAAEERLSVLSTPRQVGSWYWVSDTMVRYRPKTYWQSGTTVTVTSDLKGVRLGGGTWGAEDDSVTFRIGDAMVSTVDINDYTLTVRRNGEVLRTIPVTTGKKGWDTRMGVKVVMTKDRFITLDAATLGVPRNSVDYYRLKVSYAMRLTWSGEFLHAAPWSVADQGKANVSHGCTGMNMANAAWLYSISKPGDVFNYVDGVRAPAEPWNGYTDWNMSWAEWQQGSALS